jgi:hypothetical protein
MHTIQRYLSQITGSCSCRNVQVEKDEARRARWRGWCGSAVEEKATNSRRQGKLLKNATVIAFL